MTDMNPSDALSQIPMRRKTEQDTLIIEIGATPGAGHQLRLRLGGGLLPVGWVSGTNPGIDEDEIRKAVAERIGQSTNFVGWNLIWECCDAELRRRESVEKSSS